MTQLQLGNVTHNQQQLLSAQPQVGNLMRIAAEIAQMWPDEASARNQDAYLRLLLGASGDAAQAAEREAPVLVTKAPRDCHARATLGLACLRLDRKEEAVAAIHEPRVPGVEPVGAQWIGHLTFPRRRCFRASTLNDSD